MDISEIQDIVSDYEEKNGYTEETVKDKIVFLVEEFGEFTQAYLDGGDAESELCDIEFLVQSIVKRMGFNFEEKFREKYQVV